MAKKQKDETVTTTVVDPFAPVASPKVRKARAEHGLVDASGAPVEKEEEATGISYRHLENGDTFVYQVPGAVAGEPKTMLAVFGAKTLATHEASTAFQKGGGAEDQMANIRERLVLVETGTWIDRTRAAVTWNWPTLALAAATVAERDGVISQNQSEAVVAKWTARLESGDTALATALRNTAGVEEEYKRLVGRPRKTSADLAALL